ncbi:MAG: NADH-ubiquinone oxidoreductase-F iron-sulfur binding region domain-containing protein [Acidimicrobiales bacterium]
MSDLHFTDAEPTASERAAVDAVLGDLGPATEVESERLVRGGRARQRERRHLLLPTLIALQEEVGWISPGATNHVGRQLAVPPAEIYGVATFYELLRTTEPDGDGPTTWVCVDAACRIMADVAPVADGTVRHDAPCLGRCEQAPAVFVQRRGPAEAVPEPVPFTLPQAGDPDLRLLRRVGRVDPTSLDSYLAHGGGEALVRARELGPDAVIARLTDAGLSGRGGAAFPTGVKWRAVRDAAGERKHVVVNGDESEPGTFKDRTLLEQDPFALVEATVIAAETVGAGEAWVYIRGEYPEATSRVEAAIAQVDAAGWLRDGLRIEVRRGGGAYICGEETALFNSIEGFRGEPRNKPPFPTTNGLFDQPTAVNNPETLLNVLPIVLEGPEAYRAVGTEQSPGTRLFCLSGRIGRPGVYEAPFGIALGDLLDLAGGVEGELAAVLLGGAAGVFVGPDALDLALTLEDTRAAGATLGSGVVMVFDTTVDLTDVVVRIAEFFRSESCGQCVPCRVGTVRVHETMVQMRERGGLTDERRQLLDEMATAMTDASICGLGHTAVGAVRSALDLGLVGS